MDGLVRWSDSNGRSSGLTGSVEGGWRKTYGWFSLVEGS